VVRRPALERSRGSPEGYRGWLLDGSLRLFGPWAPLCLGPRPCGVCLVVCGFVHLLLLFSEKGAFPCYKGTLMAVPDKRVRRPELGAAAAGVARGTTSQDSQ
jgi:hypothetical protein